MEQNTPMEAWPEEAFEEEAPPSNPLMARAADTARSVARTLMENVANPLVDKAAMVPQAVAQKAVGMMRRAAGAEPTPAVQPIEDKDPGRTDQYFRRGDSAMKMHHVRTNEMRAAYDDLFRWVDENPRHATPDYRNTLTAKTNVATDMARRAQRNKERAVLMGFLADRSRSRVGPGTTLEQGLEKQILSYL